MIRILRNFTSKNILCSPNKIVCRSMSDNKIHETIIKSIEYEKYCFALTTLKNNQKTLSIDDCDKITKCLNAHRIQSVFKFHGFVLVGQTFCYFTENYALFPILMASPFYVSDIVYYEQLESVTQSIIFQKRLESEKH